MLDDKDFVTLELAALNQRLTDARAEGRGHLNLSGLNLKKISPILFEEDGFVSLDLSNNNLTELPFDFIRLSNLTSINISSNEFRELPQILCGMSKLNSINANSNYIIEVPDSIGDLQSLIKLSLEGNKLTNLPSSLGKLNKIQHLSFSENELKEIPEFFKNFKQLRYLEFDRNLLTEMPEGLRGLKNLFLLDLSQNKIDTIPDWISELTGLGGLNVSQNNIKSLPPSFCHLKKMRHLSISQNRISSLPDDFSELIDLERFYASDNLLARLPNRFESLEKIKSLSLSSNGFTSFPSALTKLKNLEELIISANEIVIIPKEISNLQNLETLHIWGNLIYSLPEEIGELKKLKRLDVANNHLRVLPRTFKLLELQHLDLSINELEELPDYFAELGELAYLNVERNDLYDLPESLLKLSKLAYINLRDNPRLELPKEILETRDLDDSADDSEFVYDPKTILSYYFARRAGTRPLNEMKLVVVGRGAAGKTSLLKRLIKNAYDPDELETPGIEISLWNVRLKKDELIRVHAWDFGGQEILHATHQFFFSERCLYLLVLTGRDGQQQADAEYWLQLIGSFGGDSKVIVVLNKCVQHKFDLNRQTLREKYPGRIVDFRETDCAADVGIPELKTSIFDEIENSEHRKIPFPEIWFNIKEELARMHVDYFGWEKFSSLCRQKGEFSSENQLRLADYLHALGIALNYSRDSRLADTHVLNPRWVTEGVYTLLRSRQGTGEASIDVADLSNILDPKHYPKTKHDFLLRLMQLYQLCFKLPQQEERYLIPELLSPNQPLITSFLDNADLTFFYAYSVLPEGLLPRFIVQTHAMSEGLLRWRSGVQLRREGCDAIVIADAVDKIVKIYIKGSRAREFLAIIRQKFDEQHQALKGVIVAEKIPIKGFAGRMLDYRDLIKREERREASFYPENMDVPVNVRQLLDGVESPAVRQSRKRQDLRRESARKIVNNHFHYDGDVNTIFGGTLMKESNEKTIQSISGGSFHQSAVVGKAENFNWQVNSDNPVGLELKQQLDSLTKLVEELIKNAPTEIAESAARNMTVFSEQVLAKKPDSDYLAIAAKKLGAAAAAVTTVANPVIETVEKIMKLVGHG